MRDLTDFIPGDYMPPYRATLTPKSFEYSGDDLCHTWTVVAKRTDGVTSSFEIVARPDCSAAYCRMDGVEQRYVDPYTMRTEDRFQKIAAWYDWILVKTVLAVEEEPKPWDADDVDTMMWRMQARLVAYSEEEESVSQFATLADFQAWIDKATDQTSHQVRAYAIAPMNPKKKPLMLRTYREVLFGADIYKPATLTAWFTPYQFHTRPFSGWPWPALNDDVCWPAASVFRSGSELQRASASFFLSREEFLRAATLSTCDTDTGWWCVEFVGTDILLPVPRDSAMVRCKVDEDGAYFHIYVVDTREHAEVRKTEDLFRRRWGRWLDTTTILSEDELAQGVAEIEARVVAHGKEQA